MATPEEMRDAIARAEKLDELEDEAETKYETIAPPQAPSQVYSLRLPVESVEKLRVVASDQGVAPTTLLRQWVLERLQGTSPSRSSQTFWTGVVRNEMSSSQYHVVVFRHVSKSGSHNQELNKSDFELMMGRS